MAHTFIGDVLGAGQRERFLRGLPQSFAKVLHLQSKCREVIFSPSTTPASFFLSFFLCLLMNTYIESGSFKGQPTHPINLSLLEHEHVSPKVVVPARCVDRRGRVAFFLQT